MVRERFENGKRVIDRWDRVFRAVAAEPRRQLVVSLMDASPDRSVPLPESAVNPNVPVHPDSLRDELHHVHLPMLSDMEFVEVEDDPFAVARGDRFEEVAVVFRALHSMAEDLPDSLVVGCQRLERERQFDRGD